MPHQNGKAKEQGQAITASAPAPGQTDAAGPEEFSGPSDVVSRVQPLPTPRGLRIDLYGTEVTDIPPYVFVRRN
jgi:hypothetical protein